jgi:hypothetical protein
MRRIQDHLRQKSYNMLNILNTEFQEDRRTKKRRQTVNKLPLRGWGQGN